MHALKRQEYTISSRSLEINDAFNIGYDYQLLLIAVQCQKMLPFQIQLARLLIFIF